MTGASPKNKGGRPCLCCRSAEREAIEAMIASGETDAAVSRRFFVSADSVRAHRGKHLPSPVMVAAIAEREAAEGEHGIDLLAEATRLLREADGLLTVAKGNGDAKTALLGVREAARCLELIGKLVGSIDTSTTINVAVAPVMIELQAVVLRALQQFPEARAAVAQALASLAGGPPTIDGDMRPLQGRPAARLR